MIASEKRPHLFFTWPSAPIIGKTLNYLWARPRKLWHLCGRRIAIKRYLSTAKLPRLQIGAAGDNLRGWLNTDLDPGRYGMVRLDATQPFPFSDEVFQFIFSEHMIEHITLANARTMLAECHRILRPNGWIRIATPNLSQVARLALDSTASDTSRFLTMMAHRHDPLAGCNLGTLVVNDYFYGHGHRFIYNIQMLSSELIRAGFINIRTSSPGISLIPEFEGVESHQNLVGTEANAFETMVLEAQRPPKPNNS